MPLVEGEYMKKYDIRFAGWGASTCVLLISMSTCNDVCDSIRLFIIWFRAHLFPFLLWFDKMNSSTSSRL